MPLQGPEEIVILSLSQYGLMRVRVVHEMDHAG